MEKTFTLETVVKHSQMLANRCQKNFKKLKTKFDKENVESFRIYHWDIPEVRCVVDWYKGHLVVAEYTREQTQGLPYLETISEQLQKTFGLGEDKIHLKRRQTRQDGAPRYSRLDRKDEYLEIQEGQNKFLVNLDDYVDTGLFNDHRITRQWIEAESRNKNFLNLYCYTGTFTVSAARGGAYSTTSVDMSTRYLQWLESNLAVNQISSNSNQLIQEETQLFIKKALASQSKWDLIWLDPPSFSTARDGTSILDVMEDHNGLIKDCLRLLSPNGKLYFSTNHQRFRENFKGLEHARITCLTENSTPEDYARYQPHMLWSFEI